MAMDKRKEKKEKEFDELLLEVRRVTRVTTGWRRLSFRATILVGNKKWKIWLGISKAQDVATAVKKATNEAYKDIFQVPVVNANTVPYPITYKYKSAIIKLLPAAAGTGLKAGSSVRLVLDLAWYNNILSKIVGTNNRLNNALATIQALSGYKAESKFVKETSKDKDVKEAKVEIKATSDKKPQPKKEEKKPVAKAPAKKEATKKPVAKTTAKPATKKATVKKATATKKPVAKPVAKAKVPTKKTTKK